MANMIFWDQLGFQTYWDFGGAGPWRFWDKGLTIVKCDLRFSNPTTLFNGFVQSLDPTQPVMHTQCCVPGPTSVQ